MTKTKNARPGTAIPGRAVENGTASQTAHVSTHDSTTPAAERQPPRIADLLHPGAENAVPRRDLMALTGYTDRELRRQIETERRRGCPILSDNAHGYWLSDSPAEIKRFSRSMRRRAAEIRLTAMRVEGGQAIVRHKTT